MKTQRIINAVMMTFFLMVSIAYAQIDQPQSEPQGQVMDAFELARGQASSSLEVQKEMLVHRLYSLTQCTPYYLWRAEDEQIRKKNPLFSGQITPFQNHLFEILTDVGILQGLSELGRSGFHPKNATNREEYTLSEYDFHEKTESEGNDGDEFAIVRILVGTCNSMAAEDIDLMYYVIRNLLFRPLGSSNGTYDDDDVVIGDACYNLSGFAFGFLRGNVVVEIKASQFVHQNGRIEGSSRPDKALRAKMVEAARRIDALLMEKMFTEETRTRIRAAELKRDEAIRIKKTQEVDVSNLNK